MPKLVSISLKIDEKAFAMDTGFVFRGFSVNQGEQEWVAVIRAISPKKELVYAISSGENPVDVVSGLLEAVSSQYAAMFWRKDGLKGGKKR